MKKIISILFISIILLDIFPILDVSAEKNVDTDTNIYISEDGNYKYKKEYVSFGESNDEYLNKKSQGVRLVKYVGKKSFLPNILFPKRSTVIMYTQSLTELLKDTTLPRLLLIMT